jgi:uncharacterized protein (DUF305 family)
MTRRLLVLPLLIGLAGTAFGQQARPAAPLYTGDDVAFLTHMLAHHQQAIDMAALVPTRSDRQDFLKFARYLAGAQQAEIDQMKTLLQAAADRGQPAPHHDMSGDPPMPGMLSKAQMAALEAARGAEFTRLWLRGMIRHHQGAIDMALAQQQREFESRRQPYGIAALADDILATQRGEIGMMRKWLAGWGLEDSGPGR